MPEAVFAKVAPELDFPKEEQEILRFWRERHIFEKTLQRPAPRGSYVFYEGPPTANGTPHNGHVLTRVIKDLFPRYRTMQGWRVPRKAGWDTHGLPVEVEVEKELRLHGKAAVEQFGVEPFVRKCIDSVFRYTREWESLTERVAFWVDLGDAYVTYHRSYVESVWWALGELFKKGLLYRGHKVVWWWAQGGTALSSAEVGQGYRSVDDPSVMVAFPVTAPQAAEDVSLLVWTTTPWTLPSNMFAAVHPDFDYAVVRTEEGRGFVVAERLVETLASKVGPLRVERRMKGRELEGWEYRPPFDVFEAWGEARARPSDRDTEQRLLWRVVLAPFVTLDAGTGIVHIAPAFGEDDHDVFRREAARFSVPREGAANLELLCAVAQDGTFVGEVPVPGGGSRPALERYAGRWVKDCDKEIAHDLKDRGLLVHSETYRHDYPYCWRADSDPLIQYARPAWYIRTTQEIGSAIANNRAVHWLPEHIKEGRFGDFLAHNVDWALSRERWWGTPLNLWVCDGQPEHTEAFSSVDALEERNPRAFEHFHAARRADPTLSEHLIVHKPWIDQVTVPCASCGGTMRRVPEVIDCWFDSGCMPFAQWGYPHVPGSREKFAELFPADFISEAIDQTRGWFYSLLMISTLVFGDRPKPHPFKTCIVLGHVTDKEGRKESKSKGNYTPPEIIFDRVAMEFAVIDDASASPGVAVIGRDDLDGLDLQEGATVHVSRRLFGDRTGPDLALTVRVNKRLRRRVVALHASDRAVLGVIPVSSPDVAPAAVPRLPAEERVVLEDRSTPAPGADAFRWFFYAASPPWSATRHSLSNVRALQKEFAVKLRHVYSFFTIYAAIDGFDPLGEPLAAEAPMPELDRWIRSEVAMAVRDVTAFLDEYDAFGATSRLTALVDALSNWWVRRSRARFWRSGWDGDKVRAYATLYEALVTITKLSAPFTPFGAEAMWQNLLVRPSVRAGAEGSVPESVHLADWPAVDPAAIDEQLSVRIARVRALASLGLQVRTQAKIRVRQPLRSATLVTARPDAVAESDAAQIADELNVLETRFVPMSEAADYVEFRVKPNFRSLGSRGLGKEAQALKKTMGAMTSREAGALAAQVLSGATAVLGGVDLRADDVEVELVAKPGFAAAGDRVGVVLLDTQIDETLRELGLVREIVNRAQAMRKDLELEYTDRVRLAIAGGERVHRAVGAHGGSIASEVLAVEVTAGTLAPRGASVAVRDAEIDGEAVRLEMDRA
jgi:isoleucyl-tRNA synthetase